MLGKVLKTSLIYCCFDPDNIPGVFFRSLGQMTGFSRWATDNGNCYTPMRYMICDLNYYDLRYLTTIFVRLYYLRFH